MVFTPDSKTGHVLGESNTVIPFDVKTGRAGRPIVIGPDTAGAAAMAITPDGKSLYVANYGTGTVVPVSTATGTAGRPIRVGYEPTFIAITPDGATAYVVTGTAVVPIDVAAGTAGKPITVRNFAPDAVVITPDGRTAWVSGGGPSQGRPIRADRATGWLQSVLYTGGAPGYLLPISIATNTPGKLIKVGADPSCLIAEPWRSGAAQGPVACNP